MPHEFGVNVHFVEPDEQEVKMIQEGGFSVVRTDLFWDQVERVKGTYDFSEYDKFVNAMSKYKIKVLFILDYGNPYYDNGNAPYTDEGRDAFARFAQTSVRHFASRDIIWEIWNEPNSDDFWPPKQNNDDYCKLALNVVKSIKSIDSEAKIIAPAVSGIEWDFLTSLGKYQLVEQLDGISVHPYRSEPPESVFTDYSKLRLMLDQFSPNKKTPIITGEWGYSTTYIKTDEKQAQYITRLYLTDILCGVPMSIWYDWRDDGQDKNNSEYNFGVIRHNKVPKTAYYAVKTLTRTLMGYTFIKQIPLKSQDDYALLFENGTKAVLAVWTTQRSHSVKLKIKEKSASLISITGSKTSLKAGKNGFEVQLSQSPNYLLFSKGSLVE